MESLKLKTMLKLKSSDIKDFPFNSYADLNNSQLEDLAKEHYLTAYNSWMLPQINAHLATWELKRNAEGTVDCMATAAHNIKTNWDIGLWKVITKLKRGSLVKAQSNPEFVNFSALVPIILAAHKRFNGVPYRAWKVEENCPLIEASLLEAMLYEDEVCSDLGSDRLLEIREIGLTTKSGPNAGRMSKPTSSWCLRGIKDTELGSAPKLYGTMLTQIWVAHPSLRTEYMILDPGNWDRMPSPLVDEEAIFSPKAHKEDNLELPWLTKK